MKSSYNCSHLVVYKKFNVYKQYKYIPGMSAISSGSVSNQY